MAIETWTFRWELPKLVLLEYVKAAGELKPTERSTEIVRIVTSLVLGSVALACGLSFGQGTCDIVHNLAAGFHPGKVLEAGKQFTRSGESGVLSSIAGSDRQTGLIVEVIHGCEAAIESMIQNRFGENPGQALKLDVIHRVHHHVSRMAAAHPLFAAPVIFGEELAHEV